MSLWRDFFHHAGVRKRRTGATFEGPSYAEEAVVGFFDESAKRTVDAQTGEERVATGVFFSPTEFRPGDRLSLQGRDYLVVNVHPGRDLLDGRVDHYQAEVV